jgi:L-aspartate oxidase
MERKFDFLVIGSGLAGMSFALKVAEKGKVAIICKTTLDEANTFYAQGGIASVMDETDEFEQHIQDTLVCGDGHCDASVVDKVVRNAPFEIKQLVEWGVDFDKNKEGKFDLHIEGGHSKSRILHHKDNTGAEIQLSLVEQVKSNPNIHVFEHHFAVEIITQHHLGQIITQHTKHIECYGAYIVNEKNRSISTFLSKVTMMATGGIGNVYHSTSNPTIATGDGIAMAHRARADIKDMEFVQFHPTVLYNPNERPSFLISEALRV